jgi:hypothetical protein
VIDDVDRGSFAERLVPLYSRLAPGSDLQALVREAQADDEIASVP